MGSVSKLCWKHLSLLSIHSKYDMRAPIRHRLESLSSLLLLSLPTHPTHDVWAPVRLRLESLSPSLSLAPVRLRLKSQSLLSTHPTHEVRAPIQFRLESLSLSLSTHSTHDVRASVRLGAWAGFAVCIGPPVTAQRTQELCLLL